MICGKQAKRAMNDNSWGFLPVRGIRRKRIGAVHGKRCGLIVSGNHPARPRGGTNFNWRGRITTHRPQRVGDRRRQPAQPDDQHSQPHRQTAAQQISDQKMGHSGRKRIDLLVGLTFDQWECIGAVATGTFNSILLSTPLASLKTSVSGTVLSLGNAAFRSINITW